MSATLAGIVLAPRTARTAADAEALRQIRNACARWMTGYPHPLTVAQQRAWWASPARRQSAIWLFDDPEGMPVVMDGRHPRYPVPGAVL